MPPTPRRSEVPTPPGSDASTLPSPPSPRDFSKENSIALDNAMEDLIRITSTIYNKQAELKRLNAELDDLVHRIRARTRNEDK